MSKITFLNPPFHYRFSRESRSPAVAKSGTLYYPKWLSYAAGLAIKKGHNVDLIDAPAKGRTIDYCIDRIKNRIIAAKPYLDSIIDYQFVENLFKKRDKDTYIENVMNLYCLSTWFIKKHR